jgi:AmmeMemoRadiSam system protein A
MFQLREQDKQILLGIARDAVTAHLSGNRFQPANIESEILLEDHGVFVSIHNGTNLRGCIGNVMPDQPLHQTIARCAVAAATTDPRFRSMTLSELPHVSFELSVLGVPELVKNVDEIEVGTHGLIVSKGHARGLLLPQVATQYGWDRKEFLEETCIKAGLHRNAWKEGATIHRFTAEVFSETDVHQQNS